MYLWYPVKRDTTRFHADIVLEEENIFSSRTSSHISVPSRSVRRWILLKPVVQDRGVYLYLGVQGVSRPYGI